MKKIYVWMAIIAVMAIVVFLNWDLISGKMKGIVGDSSSNGDNANGSLDFNKILKKGVGTKANPSEEVRFLQKLMNQYQSQPKVDEDGVFGSDTEAKLLALSKGKFSSVTLSQVQQLMMSGFQ